MPAPAAEGPTLPATTQSPTQQRQVQYVVRGGRNSVDRWVNGAERVENGVLYGISVQTWPDTPIETLTSYLPHSTISVATLDAVLAAGGVTRPDPFVDPQTGAVINPYHALLDGLTAEQGVALFSDTRPNTTRLRR